jgi:phosphoribosylformylglycinamidine (FGAM) synthase-like amidotransferase family enzyme
MCRHGEGKMQFYSKYGLISATEANHNRIAVNENHVLLRYVNPETMQVTEDFPYSPNGSVDGIAGLVNSNGNIFGNMMHPEVSVYKSRDLRFFKWKDEWRRLGIKAEDIDDKKLEGIGLKIFQNIVNHVR